MICFLALVLRVIFSKKIKTYANSQEKKKNKSSDTSTAMPLSFTEVLQDVFALHAIGLEVKNQSVVMRTELQPKATLAFQALGMSPPKRILSSEPLQVVVPRVLN